MTWQDKPEIGRPLPDEVSQTIGKQGTMTYNHQQTNNTLNIDGIHAPGRSKDLSSIWTATHSTTMHDRLSSDLDSYI